MLTIGCHLSSSKGYEAMARAAASIDANTFQFFTRNPRGGKAKAIDPADVAAFERRAAEEDIDVILAHAPYTLNPAAADGRVRDFARATFADDLVRMEATPGQLYNFHPGSHVKQGAEVGIAKIAAILNEVLAPGQSTTVLLETMAGKGTEVGGRFEELAAIIDQVELDGQVGVCLDTCHVFTTSRAIWTACSRSSTARSGSRACAPCTSTTPSTRSGRAKTATRPSARDTSASKRSRR